VSAENNCKFACFSGQALLRHGSLAEVATAAKARLEEGSEEGLAIFSDETGRPVDLDLRGSLDDVLRRLARRAEADGAEAASPAPTRSGPGRPKLGVVSKEVTLLPRHWDWLGRQPGGASATLRRLVEEARRSSGPADAARRSQEAAYRFMSAMAGDLAGFEEATRAFFAHDFDRFQTLIDPWPRDVRDHVRRLAAIAAEDLAKATRP